MCKFAPLCRFSRDFLQANVGFGYMGEYVGVKVMLRGRDEEFAKCDKVVKRTNEA